MASSQQPSGGHAGAPGMYFCHMCSIEIRPLLTPQPTCPRCNGGFVEEVESSRSFTSDVGDDNDEDDDDDGYNDLQNMWGGGLSGARAGYDSSSGGLDLGTLMGSVLRNLASAGQDRPRDRVNVPNRPTSAPSAGADSAANPEPSSQGNEGQSGFRSGTTRLGPVNVSWGFGSQTIQGSSGSGNSGRNDIFGTAGSSHMQAHTPTGHDDFVRRSLEEHARQHAHVHDDGMGGAGGAADGRFFNHDNTGQGFDHDEDEPSEHMPGATPSHDEPSLPPELASLREVFSNLFGGLGDGPAGMLMDLLGGAVRGGRSGDYVWGQQGLDDVISQLMEQTRGSTAPPPASEDAIARLERFSRKDREKVRGARNRECSTCMDSFFDDDEEEADASPSMDTNLPTGLKKSNDEAIDADADDPPEQFPAEEQQDELVMMPCRHLFHQDCLIPWLKTSSTCPVCRVSIEPKHEEAQQEQRQQEAESSRNARHGVPSFPSVSSTPSIDGPTPRLTEPFSAAVEEREDTDVEDDDRDFEMTEEGPDQRRERMRKAAESRMQGSIASNDGQSGSTERTQTRRLPGSFLPADDLD